MSSQELIALRITQLCKERQIAINSLAILSNIPPSTIYSMIYKKSKNPGIESLKKICHGLGISLREFFDCELFEEEL